MSLNSKTIKNIIKQGLDEDLDHLEYKTGDITSRLTISKDKIIKFQINSRENIVLCGSNLVKIIFIETAKRLKIKKPISIKQKFFDGDKLKQGQTIIEGSGNALVIFAAERLLLNLMQHLSGIATTANQYVQELASNKTKILDTRKTLPGLRILQKYAIKTGGGFNHRFGLFDGILIKDNHIAAAGSIKQAVELVRGNLKSKMLIEVECDHLEQVTEAVSAKADIIMLDNMNLDQIKKAVKIINHRAKIEVSGGISLDKINKISKTGIDYISIGALTHSVRAADIGLDVV